jgi:outer membrane protein assembly factor BamB
MRIAMKESGSRPVLCALLLGALPAVAQPAARALPEPVHPDTLPTLQESWSLPASLAPLVTNVYAPRMALSGLLLYVYDHHGRRLVAAQANSGKVVWHAPVPAASDRAFAVTPLVANDRVFVANDGHVIAFDALSGRQVWDLRTKGVAINGLARSKHHLLVPWINISGTQALPGIHLWAVDSRTGRVEWTKKLPGGLAFALGDADGAYFVTDGGLVLGLTADRGDPRWQLRLRGGEVMRPPLLSHGKLYVTSLRRKAGWVGAVLSAVELAKGKLLWETRFSSPLVATFLHDGELVAVEANGRLSRFDAAGKRTFELQLAFGDEPLDLHGAAVGSRMFIFSYHSDGNGYVRLVDMEKKKLLATANALPMNARSVLPANKMLFLDGGDGNVHALRLDRSVRPRRASVPPEEFARQMLDAALDSKRPTRGLAQKLAGLGPKALPAIEGALMSASPVVVDVAARAVGLIGHKNSVGALVKAMPKQEAAPQAPGARLDPLVTIIEALAELHDPRAVGALQKVIRDEGQNHRRRRAAYVALGAIGTPVSLAPIWAFRAARQVPSFKWEPQAFTPSFDHHVESDVEVTAETWPESIRRQTTVSVQTKNEQVYTAALSPYLGGYNDIWLGKSDLSGIITAPFFTGLTRPEMTPNRRIRLKRLAFTDKGEAELGIEIRQGSSWAPQKPVRLSMETLAADSDGDRLPDLVERRLHLCVHNPDCDGDGLKDSEDLNPLASGKGNLSPEQRLFREAFFTFYAFLKRRGVVVVDAGDGPSFELYGRQDPVISLRRTTIEKFRREVGLHAVDYVSFGGPYPEGGGSGDALPAVVWNKKKTEATMGMDIFRSGENAAAYNVTLKKMGKSWVVTRFFRVWTTN